MVNIKNKKCKCGKVPTFNFPDETKAICCSRCKIEGMIAVFIGYTCKCGVRATYNYMGETKGICCSKCKEKGMINLNFKKSKGKDVRQPHFNYSNETSAICCNDCKHYNMVDIKHRKCPNCIDWVDSMRGNKKYKGYCTRCFHQRICS